MHKTTCLRVGMCCLLWCLLAGCGPHMSASVLAESLVKNVPRDKTWELVAEPDYGQNLQELTNAVNGPLEEALTVYGWKKNLTDALPEVLVRVWWSVSPPVRVLEINTYYFEPYPLGFEENVLGMPLWEAQRWGMTYGARSPWAGGMSLYDQVYRGRRAPRAEVTFVFERRMFVEALLVAGMSEEERASLRMWQKAPNANGEFPRGMSFAGENFAFWGQTGYLKAPENAVLWQVSVKSIGSSSRIEPLFPLFSAAAARYMGLNAQVEVHVNEELEVTDVQ